MSENITDPPQQSDLLSIGAILRKKREEHSYTLEHVSEITRITLTCLRNIEEGNLDALPGLVFVRGFIRNYAKLLGLESDWMIEALNQTYSDRTQPNSDSDQPRSFNPLSQPEKRSTSPLILVGALVIISLIAFLVYWQSKPLSQYSSTSSDVETIQAIDAKAPAQEVAQEALEAEIQKTTAEIPAPPVKPEISPLTLTLVAMNNDWIHLTIDEQESFDLRLKKGEKYEWPAKEGYALIMTTGNTALIHLNGEEIVDRENFKDELYQVKLNKFTLTRINNR
ncbi:MAG: helix-turn-helix domain-containing protein [Deltaproteobacteria bacterium]|jgi:cytoskeleton protein RodZ|nr:helix-turn-helix domain-containing protein [Deltaproteobacteria bacterium]MBT4087369.1 helix-turn-helix domain-containing protein [Deltaproteobacteria bacterium]MBT4267258.1 helix-turn-helix domain-containing protein [Deltaproteobacteria bacterium]MBT4639350.1 helix-turn-helix domain-containing protein [Deltaproteobacteria bacterium]MBT6504646.1 helix-turn-helix domain-containing protein [Deltaproteobacteria bacterium]